MSRSSHAVLSNHAAPSSVVRSPRAVGARIDRPCYVCGTRNNPLIASEVAEERFGRPLMPEGVYDFARCRTCGTLYVDSDVDSAYLESLYRDETVRTGHTAEDEARAHAELLHVRLPEFRRHWALLQRIRPVRTGDALLDMGCQMGDFAALAQADGVTPWGIELSAPYRDQCEARWNRPGSVHLGTVTTAPFAPRSFAYITAFETLEHIMDPLDALQQFHRWLAPDGLVAFSVPSSDYFHAKVWLLDRSPLASVIRRVLRRRSAFYAGQVLPHTHVYNFTIASARMLLARAGFRAVSCSVTGWHATGAPALNAFAKATARVSRGRIAFAPSVLVVGRKARAEDA